MNIVHIYLMVCICLLGYLQLTNIMYIFRKFNSKRKQVSLDRRMRCANVLTEFSRTLYLTVGGTSIVFWYWDQDTNSKGYFESVTKFDCKKFRYIPVFVQMGLIQFPRLLFAFSRLYQMKRMLGQRFGRKNIVVLGILFSCMCAIDIWAETIDDVHELEYEGHPICYLKVRPDVEAVWICVMTMSELVMLWLYIYPLYKLDLGRGKKFTHVSAYSSFQKDKTESLLAGQEAYTGMSLTDSRDTLSSEEEVCSPDLLKRYHQFVLRNFISGIIGILIALQFMIVFLTLLSDQKMGARYWFSGAGVIHCTLTFFTIYICIVLSDRDWRMVLIPCARKMVSENPQICKQDNGDIMVEFQQESKKSDGLKSKHSLEITETI